MPCNTRQINQVATLKADLSLLSRALQAMGLSTAQQGNTLIFNGYYQGRWVSGKFANGNLICSQSLEINTIKRAYAAEIVKHSFELQYQSHGWTMNESAQGFQFQNGQDIMNIEILEDGAIKTESGPISAAQHMAADAFLGTIGELAGGAVERTLMGPAEQHEHEHEHQHEERHQH